MKKKMITLDIPIPTSDGKSVSYTIPVEVPARFDEDYQDYILDGNALAEIERVKARHMGLLQPEEIKELRERLGVTQQQISELLQIGAKSWSRWETGRARPSRSMNILIRALNDGSIDLNYLRSIRAGKQVSPKLIDFLKRRDTMKNQSISVKVDAGEVCKNEVKAA